MIVYSGETFALETERLVLRPFVEADVAPYAAINADPAVMRWLGGPRSLEVTVREMQQANDSLGRDGFGSVAMARKADGVFVGMCGFSIEEWYSPTDHEIGWRLAPAFQGIGYATEAARTWLDYGFGPLGLKRVISIADAPNFASIRVMQRLGMQLFEERALNVHGDVFDAVVFELKLADQQ